MPGYVIHVAVAQEYIKKRKIKGKEEIEQFIKGSVAPDLVKPKSLSHYGKSPAYTSLKEFLLNNKLDTSFQKGFFLHLITDYLFYNYYLDNYSKEFIYDDYDILNEDLIHKYDVILPKEVCDYVFFKKGVTKILNMELACKIIDEVSSCDIEKIVEEVGKDDPKWSTYKKLV